MNAVAMRIFALILALTVGLVVPTMAATKKKTPKPTLSDVTYGRHPKQALRFWRAKSGKPTPFVFFICDGGWMGGTRMHRHLIDMLTGGK